jgi:hypothetical protein
MVAAEVMAAGDITAGNLQPQITTAPSGDLALLDVVLATVTLQPRPTAP